jgi:xanthine dehydrogenase molybdenum-binding subunit
MRGFGNPQGTFAMESHLDIMAQKLGIDPLELRLKNHLRQGDKNYSTDAEYIISSCGLKECMLKGAKKIGWEVKRKEAKVESTKKRGIGMACAMHNTGKKPAPDISGAFLEIKEGKVHLFVGASDMGQGLCTVLSQIAAEELGVRLDDIIIKAADTDTSPYDDGTQASRGTYVVGGAVKLAATNAKNQLLEMAAKTMGTNPQNLTIANSRIQEIDTENGIGIHELLQNEERSINVKLSYEPPTNAPPFAAQFVEVEVDIETGEVKVLKMVSAHDVGRAINPMYCEGQIEGSIQMGIGYTLTEKSLLHNGKILNPSFTDYKILNALDMPEIETIFVETTEPTGPFGAKGLGEIGTIPVAPAIANAVYNATGVRITELPITPEKVLEGMRKLTLGSST